MRIAAVTCVKNEGPFLLEWIAYHRLLGVSDFLFYSNDCSDGTDLLLTALAERGLVQHLPNPAEGRNYQMEALKHARHQPIVEGADWVWIADVDEFVNIHVGDHSFAALIEAAGDVQAISVTFQFFANCGIQRFEDRPVIAQFDRSHTPDLWNGQTAIEVKTLVRKDFPLQYYGAHRPFFSAKLAKSERPRWADGSGRAVPHRFLMTSSQDWIRKFPARGARRLATLNHYALRSLDSYLVKNDRGDVNREHRDFDLGYWQARNDPAWQDRSIQRHLPALTDALADLMADPEIARLHHLCVDRHRERCAELMQMPAYRSLRQSLLDTPAMPAAECALIKELEATT